MYTTNPDPAVYAECQKRGHSPSGLVLTSNPPWDTCKHCGVAYRYDTTLVELGAPFSTVAEGTPR